MTATQMMIPFLFFLLVFWLFWQVTQISYQVLGMWTYWNNLKRLVRKPKLHAMLFFLVCSLVKITWVISVDSNLNLPFVADTAVVAVVAVVETDVEVWEIVGVFWGAGWKEIEWWWKCDVLQKYRFRCRICSTWRNLWRQLYL